MCLWRLIQYGKYTPLACYTARKGEMTFDREYGRFDCLAYCATPSLVFQLYVFFQIACQQAVVYVWPFSAFFACVGFSVQRGAFGSSRLIGFNFTTPPRTTPCLWRYCAHSIWASLFSYMYFLNLIYQITLKGSMGIQQIQLWPRGVFRKMPNNFIILCVRITRRITCPAELPIFSNISIYSLYLLFNLNCSQF